MYFAKMVATMILFPTLSSQWGFDTPDILDQQDLCFLPLNLGGLVIMRKMIPGNV